MPDNWDLFTFDIEHFEREIRETPDAERRATLLTAKPAIEKCLKDLQSVDKNSRRFHLRAEECRAFADCSGTDHGKTKLAKMAEVYERMATQAEASETAQTRVPAPKR